MPGNMKGHFKSILACALLLAAAPTASAKLYQYKDQNGITRLTNNIYSVPPAQRSQLEPYTEIKNIPEEMEIQPLRKKIPEKIAPAKIMHPKTVKDTAAVAQNVIPPVEAPPPETGAAPPAPTVPAAKALSEKPSPPAPDARVSEGEAYESREIPPQRKKSLPSRVPILPDVAEKSPDHGTTPPPPEIIPQNPSESIALTEKTVSAPPEIPEPAPIVSPPPLPPSPAAAPEKPAHLAETPIPEKTPRMDAMAQPPSLPQKTPKPESPAQKILPDLASLEITRKSLSERKEALNQKYMILMQEKEALETSVDENNEESVLKYNEKVKELNVKIYEYKKEKRKLQADIEDYNKTIREVQTN